MCVCVCVCVCVCMSNDDDDKENLCSEGSRLRLCVCVCVWCVCVCVWRRRTWYADVSWTLYLICVSVGVCFCMWVIMMTTRYNLVCTATHCNTLQHTATHCNTLQHTATRCNNIIWYAKVSGTSGYICVYMWVRVCVLHTLTGCGCRWPGGRVV